MNKIFRILMIAILLCSVLLAVSPSQPVYAAGIVVDTDQDDATAGDGDCTLREAINNANGDNDTTSGDCTAGTGVDVITFAGDYTIALGSTLPNITDTDNLTIDGSGVNVTIDGSDTYRLFFVNANASITLQEILLEDGACGACSGGGFYTQGNLTITDSTVLSSAQAIYNFNAGVVTISNSTFDGNTGTSGAAIYNGAELNVTDSVFNGNTAGAGSGGGGIYNGPSGEMTVSNSLFTNNSGGRGAAIYNANTTDGGDPYAVVVNNTFSGNSNTNDVGASLYNQGKLVLTNNTFANNTSVNTGYDVYQLGASAEMQLYNNIISNTLGAGKSCGVGNGTASGNNNLVENATGACGFTDGVNGNIVGSSPSLNSLADNGGPTQTMTLLINSPALNSGDNAICAAAIGSPSFGAGAADQRGETRPAGGQCDMGAFEDQSQDGPDFIVNSDADTDDSYCSEVHCTLREAINAANADADVSEITFADDYTITLDGSQLPFIYTEMTISGNSAEKTIIQASTCNPITLPGGCTPADHRIIKISNSETLGLSQVTLQYGNCDDSFTCDSPNNRGGAIYVGNGATLNLSDSVIADNFSVVNGGGINNHGGTVLIDNSIITRNEAPNGGGIYNEDNVANGVLTITNSTISDNIASNGAGLFHTSSADISITGTTFSGNTAGTTSGGGIFSNNGTLIVTNSSFSTNAAAFGGGIYNNSSLTVTNSTFAGNSATDFGGGIFNNTASGTCVSASAATISNSTFSGNSSLYGGGVNNYSGVITLLFNTITANTATAGGGVISTNDGDTCTKAGGNIIFDNTGYDVSAAATTQRFSSIGYNLVGTGDANVDFAQEFNTTGDLTAGSYDPMLGALADNGGDTQTHALLPGSDAIDNGDDTACAAAPVNNLDQRGVARPIGSQCDIGAFEYIPLPPTDFDGDRISDPSKFYPSTGVLWWLKSSTSTWDNVWLGNESYEYAPRSNFDGDSITDPAKYSSSAGTIWYIKSSDASWEGKFLGTDGVEYLSGSDFDGDGKTDPTKLLSNGAIWYMESNNSDAWAGFWLGPETLQAISGSDFDGDGLDDPAKFIASTGVLWYWSSDTSAWVGVYMGGDTFSFVSGSDFDGDGIDDPGKYYATTNTVWWFKSTTSTWDAAWMGPGSFDFIGGNDFDGDGITDPAVYDATTGYLSWLKSSTSTWDSADMGLETYDVVN